jgi:hypothetical protein
MTSTPITPKLHGIIDYAFSAVQLVAPTVLGLNKKAKKAYDGTGGMFLTVNTLTDTPVGVNGGISFRTHQKADAVSLAGLALLSFSKFIRNDKKALGFHLTLLTIAIANYMLTDYKSASRTGIETRIDNAGLKM